ncbi:protein kinase [Brevundimonas phage AA]|uniref:Protein kinase n=1 Tax=Brevundimonas phage AA TaxID=2880937 RepID=A0AAN0KL67_9CAUD|nr:protein kinase [Brevundimonas phage BC]UCR90856.1 protein kinase [Brevundimonas phage AA]
MWREPGFNTRNNQARAAKALPLDAVLGKPEIIAEGRMRALRPNLQQLPKLDPAGPVPIPARLDEPRITGWPWRLAGFDPRVAAMPAQPGCGCTMCRNAREREAQAKRRGPEFVGFRSPMRDMEAALWAGRDMARLYNPAGPSWSAPTRGEIEAAVMVASEVGRLSQALRDTLCTVGYFASQANNRSASGQPHRNLVDEFMQSKGWEVAGNGHFSVAYTKNKLCIKLGFKSEDSGAVYAAFARDNKGLKGLPDVLDLQHHGRNSYTVVMPCLKPLSGPDKSRLSNAWMNDGGMKIGPNVLRLLASWGIEEAGTRIRDFFTGVASMDLHGDNVMRDEQGNFIITDPVSFKQ